MQFMMMIKATPSSEAGEPPNPKLMAAIGELTQEAIRSGKFLGGGGLMPSAVGAKAHLSGGKITITDGPFAEIKELIAGYAIFELASKEEAFEYTRRFLQIHADILGPGYEAHSEIRQMFMMEGDNVSCAS